MKLFKNKAGLTMVEFVAGMVIFAIMAVSTGAVLTSSLKIFTKANDLAEINTFFDNLSEELLSDLFGAVNVQLDDGSLIIDEKIIYSIEAATSDKGGILYKDTRAIMDPGYYRGKTVEMDLFSAENGALITGEAPEKFILRFTLYSKEGVAQANRDYAVRLFNLYGQ